MRISDWSSDVCSSDLSQIDKLAPIRPASTPSTVYTTDIPRTYAPANAKPRQRDTLARAPASPATMARRIGTMGSTHGVNDNNSPKTRHDRIILAQPAVARNAAMPVSPMFNTAPSPVSLPADRSEEHTSELQSLMRNSYAVFCLKKKTTHNII